MWLLGKIKRIKEGNQRDTEVMNKSLERKSEVNSRKRSRKDQMADKGTSSLQAAREEDTS